MTNNPQKSKIINLNQLMAEKLPEDITIEEYCDAESDPQHELNDPNNPRHASLQEARKSFEQSAENVSKMIRNLSNSSCAGIKQVIQETANPLYTALSKSFEKDKITEEALKSGEYFNPALKPPSIDIDYDETFFGKTEEYRKQVALERKERARREEQRHEDVKDVLVAMCLHMENQREVLENLRADQQIESKRHKVESLIVIGLGFCTLVVAILTLAATYWATQG